MLYYSVFRLSSIILHICSVYLTNAYSFSIVIVSLRTFQSSYVGAVFGWFTLDFLYWARNFQRQ